MTDDTYAAAEQGLENLDPKGVREAADVKQWFEKYSAARQFDEEARKQYAKDRRYARGDSGAITDANLIGTFIDILESFLYARDPDVDITPASSTEPPSLEAIRDAAKDMVQQDPSVQQAGQLAFDTTLAQTGDEIAAEQARAMALQTTADAAIQQKFDEIRDRYEQRQRANKAYAATLEIIIARMWKDAVLKSRGRKMTRSALTIGPGWLKAFWQERTGGTPATMKAINDLRDNIKRAAALRAKIEEEGPGVLQTIADGVRTMAGRPTYDDKLEQAIADYERQLAALQGKAERVIARGFVIDNIRGEDMTVAPGFDLIDYLDAPWIAHRAPILLSDAVAEFNLNKTEQGQATKYHARKPIMRTDEAAAIATDLRATDADAYVSSGEAYNGDQYDNECGEFVMRVEFWDRTSNSVLTGIEGLKRWAVPRFEPPATTRFYGFFLLAYSPVEGQRHPQSMPSRLAKLADEYNRIGDAERTHRMRIKPKILFLKGQIGGEQMVKINEAETGEYVGVELTNPNQDLRTLFVPAQYPAMDAAVYDRSRIVAEMERVSGVQEALSGGVNVAKTATEAEIQQTGFQARTGGKRDELEAVLQELAQYTAEVCRAHLDDEDVRKIAGPDAMWPAYEGAADLDGMVNIEIRAGSSGKPNTSAERQAWSAQLPLLQGSIGQIAQLRMSPPDEIADCYEALLRITAERSGDRLDVDQLVPRQGAAPVLPGMPGAPAGPVSPGTPPTGGAAIPEPANAAAGPPQPPQAA